MGKLSGGPFVMLVGTVKQRNQRAGISQERFHEPRLEAECFEMSFMARIFSAAGVFADQIAGAWQEAFKFLIAVELRQQRLPDDFRFRAVQVTRRRFSRSKSSAGNFTVNVCMRKR